MFNLRILSTVLGVEGIQPRHNLLAMGGASSGSEADEPSSAGMGPRTGPWEHPGAPPGSPWQAARPPSVS